MATTTYGTPYVASSDLVSAYPGTSSTLATRIDDISLKGNGLNNQTGTAYTLVLTDGGKTITLNNASAVTVTIPTNTSVAFPLGTEINLVNKGAGTVTIQPAGGVTLNGGNLTLPQFAAVQVVKLETDTWGQLESVGSAPGLQLITTSTFTTATTVSVNNCFSSTYTNYKIALYFTPSVGSSNLSWRFRASGSDNTSAVYQVRAASLTPVTAYSAADQTTATIMSTATGGNIVSVECFNPQASAYTQCMYGADYALVGQTEVAYTGSFSHLGTNSFDGFTIYPGTGNITGTVRIYGYRN